MIAPLLHVVSVLAVGLCLAGSPQPALAQAESPPKPAATEADKPPQPAPIAVADIAGEAAKLESSLKKRVSDVEQSDLVERATKVLDELIAEIATHQESIEAGNIEQLAANDLSRLETTWAATGDELAKLAAALKDAVSKVGDELAEIAVLVDQWKRTGEGARGESAPDTVLAEISSIDKQLEKTRKTLEKHRNDILEVQSRSSKQRDTIQSALEKIQTARSAALGRLLERNSEPLWRVTPSRETFEQGIAELRARYAAANDARERYVSRQRERVVLNLLAMIVLFLMMRRARTVLDTASDSGRAMAAGKELGVEPRDALHHPLAGAVLLGLSVSPFVHLAAPPEFFRLIGLILLPAWLLVVRGVSPAGLRRSVYLLAALAYLDIFREVLSPFVLLSRAILVVEVAAFAIVTIRAARDERARELLAEAVHGFTFRAILLWIRLAALMSAVALGAGIFGYMNLAELLARAAVRGSYLGPLLLAAVRVGEALIQSLIDSGTLDASRLVRRNRRQCMAVCERVLRFGGLSIWIYLVLNLLSARELVVSAIGSALAAPLGYGPVTFSVGAVLAFGATLWGTWILSRFLSFSLEEEIFPRVTMPPGIPFALATFTRYIVLVIGFVAAMAMLGFNVDRIALLFSALGVGIGFGLQNVTNNFVSGIIMLFERPVRVGDSVQLDTLTGEVTQIGIRASIVRTWDGADVMVPNGEFISARVTNWTFADRKRRIILPVGVAYGTDPERVLALLEELAASNQEVLAEPEPYALFTGFGDSSLDFELRAWTDSQRGWQPVRSDLAVAVNRALAEAGITIPFPQRDVHVRSDAGPVGDRNGEPVVAAAGSDEMAQPAAATDAPDDVEKNQ